MKQTLINLKDHIDSRGVEEHAEQNCDKQLEEGCKYFKKPSS